MSNTTQNSVCSGTYYDNGGASNYSNSRNYTQTFYPSAGNKMSFNFTDFNTETNWDFLYIYDGNSTSAPLIGAYTGDLNAAIGTITSTAADGSLTFRFTSDNNTTRSGWVASIACIPMTVPYKAEFSNLVIPGTASWCAGETRNVSITVKNVGTASWTSGGTPPINFSYWWSNQTHDTYRLFPFSNLGPDQSQVVTIPITAPVSGSPLTLKFDLVKEGFCWFSDNVSGCSGPGNAIFTSSNITINALPAAPLATSPQIFCTSATVANLTTTAGTNIKWYDAPTGGNLLASTTPLVDGTHYYASQTNGSGCESSARRDVIATVNPAPTTANAGPDQTNAATCGLTTVALNANIPAVGTGAWSIISGAGGSVTTASDPASAFSGVAGTAYTLRWTISSGSCTSTDDVNITFNRNPTTSNAGPDQVSSTCNQATLAANLPTVGTGVWSIISGTGGAVTTPSSGTSTFTGVPGNTYILRWTISNSPCTASTDDVEITFNAAPTTANAGPDQTNSATCGLTSVTLAGNTPSVGTGAWSIVSGTGGSIVTSSNPTSTFSGVAGNTYTLRWTITNAPCSSSDDVVITFNVSPVAATAGPDQTGTSTCGLTTVALAGNTPPLGSGAWSVISGTGGNVLNPTSPTSNFTGIAGNTYTLRWTISNPCGSTSDDVDITFNKTVTPANAGSDQTGAATCGLTNVALTGNNPTSGTGEWSIVSGTGGTITTPSSPTSTFTGMPGATYTLRWTISNAPCASSSDDVVITFNQPPTVADAGSDQTGAATCGLTSVTLAGNTPIIGTGAWSIRSGSGGNVASASNPNSTFSGTAGTTYVLRWTISNSPCTASYDEVSITFNKNPSAANAGPDQTSAATCGITFVTLGATAPAVGTGAWSIVSGTGGNIITPSSRTSTFTGVAGNTYTLRWTVSNSPCTATTDDVVITFNQAPTAANAGADQNGASTCGLTSVTLGANTPAIGTGTWSIISGSGGSVANASSPTSTFSGNAGSTYTLRWTTTNGLCSSTDDVFIKFNQNPTTADAGSDQTGTATCGLTTVSLSANVPSVGTGAWSKVSGSGGSFSSTSNRNATFTGNAGSSYVLRWTISNSPCTASFDDVNVTFNVNPTANAITQVSGLSAMCVNDALALTSNGSAGTVTWASSNTAVASVDNSGVVTGLAAGSTNITYTVTAANGCTTTSPNYAVIVKAIPTGTFTAIETSGTANDDKTICAGSTVTFTAPSGYPSYIFKVNGTSVQTGTGNTFSSSTLTNGASVTVDIANSLNCGATFGPIVITVNPLPTPSLGADKTSICPGETVTFTAGGGTNYAFKVNGTPVQSGASNTYTSNTLTNGASVTVDVTDGSSCTTTSAAVIITVNPLPTGTLTATATNICAGDNITFTATAGAGNTYDFKVNNVSVQNNSSNTYSTTTLTNGQVVTVDVTNASGCKASYGPPKVITVKALPSGTLAATETSGTPNDNSICAGTSVTFTATAGFTNYKFYNGATLVQNNASNTYTTSALTDGDVISAVVTNGGGCVATFNTVTITVVPAPTGTLSASTQTICFGDNIDFTATAGFTRYNFKVNGVSFQNGSDNTASHSGFANNDLVTVEVSNAATCSAVFNSLTITVNPLPTGALAVAETSGNSNNDGIICTGAMVTFTATTGYSNYNFKINGSTVQYSAANTYSNSALSNNDVVSVEVTSASGCVASFNNITITVNTIPPVEPITGPSAVCVNSTIALADITTGGTWSSGNTAVATVDASGNVTGVAAGVVTISYSVSNTAGCDSIVTKDITVNALPVVAAITGSSSVCIGSNITLADATTGGVWSSGDDGIATVDASGVVTGVVAGTVTISYSVTNGNGCITVVTKNITVNSLPVVPAIAGTTSVCVNSTTSLSNATAGGVWSSADAGIATVNASTGVVTGVAAGTVTISYKVTNGNGCSTTVTVDITVNALPVPTLVGPNPICLGSTDNVYTTEAGQFNYIWNVVNGTVTSGGTNTDNTITISWLTPGAKSISVNYADANGCAGATSATVVNAPGSSPTISGPASVCQNSTGNVYTTETGKIDYTWTVNGGAITSGDGTDNVTVTWNVAGARSITVNYSDPGGCSAATPTVKNVTVNPLPTIVIHDPAAVCSPATVNLAAAAITSGSTAGLTYTYWTDAAATVSYSTPATAGAGTYYIKGTTASGCYDIQPVTVTVNPTPTVVITNPGAVCSPATVDLTDAAVTSGSTAGLTFTYWTNAAATISYSTPATAGAGTYYIKGATASGCFDIQPVTVIVNPKLTVVTHNPVALCSPATADLTLTAVTSGSTAGLAFTYWTDAAATVSYSTPATAGAGTYYIKGTAASGCYDIKPVTVTVNPTPTVVITNPAAVCSPTTVDLTAAAITAGSTSGLTYSYWTDASATAPYATPATAGAGTYYIKGTTASGCYDIKPVTVIVNPTPTVVITNPGAVCSPATVNITTAAITNSSTAGLTFTYWTNAAATISYTTPTAAGAGTYYIKGTTASGCYDIKPVTVTVNPLPTVVITNPAAVCSPSTVDLTAAAITAGSTSGLTYTYWTNAAATTSYATPTTAGEGTYYIKGTSAAGCSDVKPVTVVVNALPSSFTVDPASTTICQGSIVPLSASATISSSGSKTVYSTQNNVAIPDDSNYGGKSKLTVSGIPAGAVITSISVNFNVTHEWDGELNLDIEAPNGNVLNLVNVRGGHRANFVNTTVSSTSTNPFTDNQAPFTSVYAADAAYHRGAYPLSNVTDFPSLYSIPNGDWTFSAEDIQGCTGIEWFGACLFGDRYTGVLNNWSITINYTIPNSPLNVAWSPAADLYTDPGATVAYTGTSLSTVYAKPSSSGTKTYTATVTNAAGCSISQNANIIVNPTPVVTITSNYCVVPGKVRLTATSVPVATSYIWSNGATGNSIDVDVAGTFDVTVFSGPGCPGKASIDVAQELVTNGSFEAGNVGFTSDYVYHADGAGNNELVDDLGNNGYSISADGQNVHFDFWGQDHTTGSGKYMLVNGHGNSLVVWKQTVNVLPNTTYYFSAWAKSLNDAGNYATLQFSVNGSLVGTTAALAPGYQSGSINGWTRFYGTWTSGPTITTANIYINDLQAALSGNDFGLDDVSFATLSTFIDLISAPGTDAQTVCVNTPLTDIVYRAGNGNASGPTVTGLPPGVSKVFVGDKLTISGTPTVPGNYTYTITTTGCAPYSVTGTINVQTQSLTLSSGSSSPALCINTPLTNIVYTVGGSATGASVTGPLPAGVTGSYDAGTKKFTISGTPTEAGIFNFTITTTGTCTPATATGTITVQNQTIVLSSGPAIQAVCINEAVSAIVYTVGGTATGAGVTGLPPGVTGFYSGGSFIISGTPVSPAAGTYNYTVTTTGSCAPGAALSGSIIINPAATITLSSAAGTDNQAACINSPLTDAITYVIGGGGTNASVSGLPAGVTVSYSGGVLTINGTPSVAGTFTYTITTTGTCAQATKTGTITVNTQTITLTSGSASPTLCLGSTLTNIVFTIGGTASGATLSGSLPNGITGSLSGNVFTISGSPTELGTFNYTITTSGTCATASASGTIIVNNGSIGGTLPALVSICSGGGGILNLAGSTGNIVRWESSVDYGTTWTNIVNTTTTLPYTNVMVPTQYRVFVKSGSCTGVYSSVALVAIHNYWTGGTSIDWNDASNWADNQVPTLSCDVFIPKGITYEPTLGSGIATINNLHILANGYLTVDNAALQIAGTISKATTGTFDASNGSIEFNGSSAQTISGGIFMNDAVHGLVISNSAGTGVTLSGALDIYGSLTYGKNNAILNTGGFLTLKSTITETAWIGDMTSHVINGDVTVERYIATGTGSAPNHGKSWQLLAVPTSGPGYTDGQTIKQAWQEGATATNISSPAPGSAGNPKAGYGTMITSNVAGAATPVAMGGPGFDAFTSPGPTIKSFNYITEGYDGPATTMAPLFNKKGYFLFVRGDRSVYTSNGAASPTVLRTKGTLFTPAHPPLSTTVMADKFESVGNPYASAIDMRKISVTGGAQKFFQVWDPRLGGSYNYGGFQTFVWNGTDYEVTPGEGSYGAPGSVNNFIQSGQAFFVQAFGTNGTVSFAESAKANSNILITAPNGIPVPQKTFRTSLYTLNSDGNTGSIVDGVLSNFDDAYSNSIDGLDARKSLNTGENLSIKTGGKLLVVERKHTITQNDTIFLNLTGVRVQQYQFHFDAENLNTNVEGFLEDNYLHTRTPVNMSGSTDINFSIVNIPASYAADRFRIVFAPLKALPVTFTSIKAYRQDKNINVEWKVENEMNVKQYEVEKSTDGIHFSTITIQAATANGGQSAMYVTVDDKPVEGNNYYRVKSVDINGKTEYTNIVKVLMGTIKQNISIYPNPITDGMIHLQLENQPAGKYGVRLLNKLGQVIESRQINHAEGSSTEYIKWDYNMAHGMYNLEVTRPDGTIKNINVMY